MKKIVALILSLCMVFALCACGSSAPSSSTAAPTEAASSDAKADKPEYEWTLAHHLAESSQQHLGYVKLAEDLYEKSNGRIKLNISSGAALGSQRELIEQCNLGTIEFAHSEASLLANYCEEFGLICMPFLFADEDQYVDIANNVIGDQLNDILTAKTNLRNVAWIYGGTRDVYSTKPLTGIESLAGLKIRTPESPVFVQSFQAMGANPTPVAANEMYTAIQQGVVDAMEGSLETGYNFKIYEVAKNCLQTSHILAGVDLVMNNAVYTALPDDLKAVLNECLADMIVYEGQLVADSNEKYYDLLVSEGVVFTQLSDEERAAAKEMVAGVSDEYIGTNETMRSIYDQIVAETK